jgi:diaminohydroxyphosphoribosylaminopyrimidine deaminase/5-amino-6-(5-phosphoribosylamino)uracil reductase
MIFRVLEEQYGEKLRTAKAADLHFMQLALALGRRSLGASAPNPAVGAVLVKDGVIVGRGWTQPGGRPHAEAEALRRAGEAARGATLYVTLEPCSHVGKTPPCADAVIAAGVTRVISAIEDPTPEVAGQGHARLRAAGISVEVGLCAVEAAHHHAGHFRRVRDKRPHVIPNSRRPATERSQPPEARPSPSRARRRARACICCARSATASWSASALCWPTILS